MCLVAFCDWLEAGALPFAAQRNRERLYLILLKYELRRIVCVKNYEVGGELRAMVRTNHGI